MIKYLSLISFISFILFSTVVKVGVVAKFVIAGILPLTSFILALREAWVATLVILGISFLTSYILASKVVLLARSVIPVILSSIFLILALYTSFLTRSVFTKSFSLLKSTATGTNLSTSYLSTLFFKLLELVAHFSIYQYLIYLHQILN